MSDDVFFWTRHGPWGFLSNFYRASIVVDGVVYKTTEHYFQAMKTSVPAEVDMLMGLATPTEAKLAGYCVGLRPDWEEVKEEIMLKGLIAKFTGHPALKRMLLATDSRVIHEDSPWDKYWGYAKGKGKDRLGVLLMRVRELLR